MLEGQCFCGHVHYATDGRPYNLTNCHCSICRRLSGAAFVTWFSVPAASFRFLTNEPSTIESSEHGRRTFCPRCGTPLTFRSERSPEELDVTTCSLDDPNALPPEDHTQVASKLSWVRLCDDLPAFAGRRMGGER
jgi:hypothetical protein